MALDCGVPRDFVRNDDAGRDWSSGNYRLTAPVRRAQSNDIRVALAAPQNAKYANVPTTRLTIFIPHAP